jgi:hypothetical protein
MMVGSGAVARACIRTRPPICEIVEIVRTGRKEQEEQRKKAVRITNDDGTYRMSNTRRTDSLSIFSLAALGTLLLQLRQELYQLRRWELKTATPVVAPGVEGERWVQKVGRRRGGGSGRRERERGGEGGGGTGIGGGRMMVVALGVLDRFEFRSVEEDERKNGQYRENERKVRRKTTSPLELLFARLARRTGRQYTKRERWDVLEAFPEIKDTRNLGKHPSRNNRLFAPQLVLIVESHAQIRLSKSKADLQWQP